MREAADAVRIGAMPVELGRVAPAGTRVYLTGGATAVLEGWRASTVDVDVRIEPESDAVLRRIATLKDELDLNLKLASPIDFLPELPGWRERSRSRFREENVEVLDFDPYSQALSKIERVFDLDLADVQAMLDSGLVEPARLRELHSEIEPELHRFPAVDPAALRAKLDGALP